MTTRPIALRDWQVRAALDGRLRRIVRPLRGEPRIGLLPYATGDLLWGREVWTLDGCADGCAYRADGEPPAHLAHVRWRSPVTMPKWASRWTLTVGEVRVCRVQDVTSAMAIACGFFAHANSMTIDCDTRDPRDDFARRWDADHGPGSWAANPWCVSAAVETRKRN